MASVYTYDGRNIIISDPEKDIKQNLKSIKRSVHYLIQDNDSLCAQIEAFDKKAGIKSKGEEI